MTPPRYLQKSLRTLRVLALHAVMLSAHTTSAEEILVAAASNFSLPMTRLVERFESETDHEVAVAYGSSGRLFAQISNGAPFQLFFSADQEKPAGLLEAGLAQPGSNFTYATGVLLLWSADQAREIADQSALLDEDVARIAIANPRVAPYGQAAAEAIARLGLQTKLAGKIVQGENISQAFQFVDSGNAQLGFVAKSQVFANGLSRGVAWEVPQTLHEPIKQDAVLLKNGQDCEACKEFLAFVKEASQQGLLAEMGYLID